MGYARQSFVLIVSLGRFTVNGNFDNVVAGSGKLIIVFCHRDRFVFDNLNACVRIGNVYGVIFMYADGLPCEAVVVNRFDDGLRGGIDKIRI